MSEEISKYAVVTDCDFGDFLEKVNGYMSEGWQCQGGIAVIFDTEGGDYPFNYYQAMIRE